MIIKRYRVNSMNEAVTRIRYELGKNAVIISQRKVRRKGLMGFFSPKMLEVTAAVDNDEKTKAKEDENNIQAIKDLMNQKVQESRAQENKAQQEFKPQEFKPQEFRAQENEIKLPESKNNLIKGIYNDQLLNKNNNELIKEMQQMRSMISDMMTKSSSGSLGKSKLYLKLENAELDSKLIQSILNQMNMMEDDRPEEEKLKEIISGMLSTANQELKGSVVLVGPTGVGKTTTIAKLAGRLALIEKKKVGLITIDTYRIGAVEQLKTYADIMNIPFKVVVNIKDMQTAIDSMQDRDVILIDTTGRSSKNAMQISELRAFIDKIDTDNIHLVISCTTKNKDIDVIVKGYKALNYNKIIITKLDETATYGSILNIQQSAQKPISFVTTGQNVPDDITVMTTEEITRLITGEDIVC